MPVLRRILRLRALLALLLALAGALACQLPVSARTSLLASDPPNGAALSRSPSRVSLDFDRDVSAALADVHLVDAGGRAHAAGGVTVDPGHPTRLVVALPELPRGSYRLGVRLHDRIDLQVTEMSAVFAVASTPTLAATPASYHGGAAVGVVLGWLGLLGLSVATGALLLVLAVVPAALSDGRLHSLVRRRLCAAAVAGAAVALAAQPLGLAAQALDLGGGTAGLRTLLADGAYITRWTAATATLAALVALPVVLRRSPRRGRGVEVLAVVLAVGATVATAAGADTGGDASPTLAGSALRSAHLLATGVWLGGLVGVGVALTALRPRRPGDPHHRVWPLVAGFAPWFGGATVALAVSGVLLAGAQLPTVTALLSTGYGALVAVKVALLGLVVVLAALCRRWLTPGRRPGTGVAGRWRGPGTTLGAGVAGAAIAVLLAVAMAAAPPVRDGRFIPPAAAPPAMTTVTADGLAIGFSLSPNRPGRNLVTVDVLSVDGPARAPVRGVTLSLLRPGDATARQIVAAPTLHPHVFDGGAVDLRDPGELEVGVVVSRAGVAASHADLTWRVGARGPSPQPAGAGGRQLAPLTDTAALLIVAATGLVLRLLDRRRRSAEEKRATRPRRHLAAGTATPRNSR